jgi:hypothetical protein
MALQIRRGLEANLPASPADGELLYATDTNKLYVGDGGTAQEISGGSGLGNVIEDTTPQLGGALDVNGFSIVSTNNENINITPNGTGRILLNSVVSAPTRLTLAPTSSNYVTTPAITTIGDPTNNIDGSLTVVTNTYSTAAGAGLSFGQHHTSVAPIPTLLYRSRGTNISPTALQLNDRVGAVAFAGHDGTNYITGASISAAVTGSVGTNSLPTKIALSTHNGSSVAIRAELSETGVWKTNSIQNLSGSTLTLTATTVNVAGDMQLNARGDLRFADADSSNYVAFQAPASVPSNTVWTLPGIDGTSGQVLTTDGTGILSWSTPSSGSGLSSRTVLPPATTSLLANGSAESIIITGYKGYILYKIETSAAAWVRLYSSTAAKDADSGRLEGTDPLPGSGVIAEVITTGAQTILITPGAIGFSSETVPNTFIPCTITNKSGVSAAITVTVTALQIEV